MDAEKNINYAKKQADSASEAASEILKEQVPQSSQYGAKIEVNEDNDIDLPF